jgi:hypothetical protein
METQLVSRAPQLRCHICGTATEINALCNHCGKPLCPLHAVLPAVSPSGVRLSREFADLNLDEVQFVHCFEHNHQFKGPMTKQIYVGGGIAALGLLLLVFGALLFGLILLPAGLGLGGYAYYATGRRKRELLAARPKLPLVPGVEQIEVVERLEGTLVLDEEGHYTTQTKEAAGRIDIRLAFGRPDRDRLDAYRERYELPAGTDIDFSAGFAALRGPVGLEFLEDHKARTIVPLEGQVSRQPFLTSEADSSGGQWQIALPYRFDPTSRPHDLPLWLTPSLTPEQDQRSLELELQWTEIAAQRGFTTHVKTVERLRLRVPFDWGNVEQASWASSTQFARVVNIGTEQDDAGTTWRIIEWTKARVSEPENKRRRLTVALRFKNKVNLGDTIFGSLELVFRGTFSGLTGVDLIHPLGSLRTDVRETEIATLIGADFELSLLHVRYQDIHKVPDRTGEDPRSRKKHFVGVIPDGDTIIALTNAISADDGYYVKRVIENPPRSSGTENTVNRAWDIAGRHYDKVYPVDFQITVTGQEIHLGDIRASDGYTDVELSVNGTYANPAMKARIGDQWDALFNCVVEVMDVIQKENAEARAHERVVPADDEARNSEYRRWQAATGVHDADEAQSPTLPQAPIPAQEPSPDASRLDKLLDLLIAGKISAEQFRELNGRPDDRP